MAKRRHWVHFLPEVGRPIIAEAEAVAAKRAVIEKLRQQIDTIQGEILEMECRVTNRVLREWSADDVLLAQDRAAQQGGCQQ